MNFRHWTCLWVVIYVLIDQGKGQPKSQHTFEGVTRQAVEKMLKERGVKYKIVTAKEWGAYKGKS